MAATDQKTRPGSRQHGQQWQEQQGRQGPRGQRARRGPRWLRSTRVRTGIRTAVYAAFLALMLSPFLIMLSSSLKTYNQITLWPPSLVGFEPQWSNYYEVLFGSKSIVEPLVNSMVVALASSLVCLLFGIMAAYAVTRFNFKGRGLFLFIILATQMFSSVLLVNPMYVIFRSLGLLNTQLALIIAHSASFMPMTIWLLYSYASSIPLELEEAAMIDGCSRLGTVRHVLAPLLLPGIITAGLFAFIMSWGDIIFARTFITSSSLQMVSQALLNYQDLYKTSYELQLAAGVISSLPVFILFVLIQKQLVKGMVAGGSGLKG